MAILASKKLLSNVDQAGCLHQVCSLVQIKVELEAHTKFACLLASVI